MPGRCARRDSLQCAGIAALLSAIAGSYQPRQRTAVTGADCSPAPQLGTWLRGQTRSNVAARRTQPMLSRNVSDAPIWVICRRRSADGRTDYVELPVHEARAVQCSGMSARRVCCWLYPAHTERSTHNNRTAHRSAITRAASRNSGNSIVGVRTMASFETSHK